MVHNSFKCLQGECRRMYCSNKDTSSLLQYLLMNFPSGPLMSLMDGRWLGLPLPPSSLKANTVFSSTICVWFGTIPLIHGTWNMQPPLPNTPVVQDRLVKGHQVAVLGKIPTVFWELDLRTPFPIRLKLLVSMDNWSDFVLDSFVMSGVWW